jgi:hypothetical protein
MKVLLGVVIILTLSACAQSTPPQQAGDRPQDEVPNQQTLANGDRQYGFENGCVIVLEPRRAVVRSEGPGCELYQRDIALLYASAD